MVCYVCVCVQMYVCMYNFSCCYFEWDFFFCNWSVCFSSLIIPKPIGRLLLNYIYSNIFSGVCICVFFSYISISSIQRPSIEPQFKWVFLTNSWWLYTFEKITYCFKNVCFVSLAKENMSEKNIVTKNVQDFIAYIFF